MPASPDDIWTAIRDELRRQTPDFKFHLWLEPLELAAVSGATLYVRAPEHIRTSVAERYLPLLRRAAAARFDRAAVVEIVGFDWSLSRQTAEAEALGSDQPTPDGESRLNPKYSFGQFVIGEGNRFAHAAALAVAELPSHAYNPLFLHGPPGLGKTHLLHAIGNYIGRFGSGLRVRYATIEEFTSEFVDALRRRRTDDFKDDFRGADVVLIDDVQFLAGRAKTREEFFHTFNALLESGRQLVMTSDRSPDELQDLEARLEERFRSGLVVELDPPGAHMREAILRKRAGLDGIDVPEVVLSEIARHAGSSVRALEGALIRVVAYASLTGEPPSAELAAHVLQKLPTTSNDDRLTLAEFGDEMARELGEAPESVHGRTRRAGPTRARQLAWLLAREMTGRPPSEIGRSIGRRERTTVMNGIERAQALVDAEENTRHAVDNVRRRLASRL